MNQSIDTAFQLGLNQHGYAFHHRVMRETARFADEQEDSRKWTLLAVEQPVYVRDTHTRIDFILQRRVNQTHVTLLLAECKRVNPAFGSWCFAKGAYHRPDWIRENYIAEVLTLGNLPRSGAHGGFASGEIYDIGFGMKSSKAGDASPLSNDKDGIEAACNQICLGQNGMIDALTKNVTLRGTLEGVNTITFVPVVFTTAGIFTSEIDLRDSDLASGEAKLKEPVAKKNWIFFQYPQSPQILTSVERSTTHNDDWGKVTVREYWRSIAIVAPEGIEEFVCRIWPRISGGKAV